MDAAIDKNVLELDVENIMIHIDLNKCKLDDSNAVYLKDSMRVTFGIMIHGIILQYCLKLNRFMIISIMLDTLLSVKVGLAI